MTEERADDPVDALFALPADQFVSARDGLVRQLRTAGEHDRAAQVKGLRRPTLAAWAVNQVVRGHPDDYGALVAAGEELQRAQRRALSGVRDTGLREAATVRRGLVEVLTDHAATVLSDAGARPDSHLDEVAATFEGASADRTVAERVAAGRLSAPARVETDLSGTGALLAMSLAPGEGADDGDPADGADPAAVAARREAMRRLQAAQSRAESSATTARERREASGTATRAAEEARRRAEDARAAADRAEAEAAALARQAEQASTAASTAADTADAAAEQARVARAALDDLA